MKRFMAKWSSDCIATGEHMKQWEKHHNNSCPFCLEQNETTQDIIQCSHHNLLQCWDTIITKYFNKLEKIGSGWLVQKVLQDKISSWIYGHPTPVLEEYPTLLRQAVMEQRQIGWKSFFKGLISTKWSTYIATYFKAKGNYNKIHHYQWMECNLPGVG